MIVFGDKRKHQQKNSVFKSSNNLVFHIFFFQTGNKSKKQEKPKKKISELILNAIGNFFCTEKEIE